MSFEKIDFKIDGKIAKIAMHNGSANILDFALMAEITRAIEDASSCAFLVLSSSVKNFSLGVDIKIHTPELIPEMLDKFHTLIRKLYHFPGITICFAHGYALGGGFELALVNDFLFAEQSAVLGVPEIKLACFPPVAAVLLPVLSPRTASRMMFTGDTITGVEAHRTGIADGTFEQATFPNFEADFLQKLNAYSYDALAVLKRTLRKTGSLNFDSALEQAEQLYQKDLLESSDVAEGIDAFLQKRPPKYKNH